MPCEVIQLNAVSLQHRRSLLAVWLQRHHSAGADHYKRWPSTPLRWSKYSAAVALKVHASVAFEELFGEARKILTKILTMHSNIW